MLSGLEGLQIDEVEVCVSFVVVQNSSTVVRTSMARKRALTKEEEEEEGEKALEEVSDDVLPAEVRRQQKRKIAQRGVVERRAAHFARAQPSSTPTGFISTSSTSSNTVKGEGDDADSEQKEAWCGPFATAHRLLHQREQAKAKREKRIMDKENGVDLVSDDENEDDGDENAYHIFDEYVANFIDGNKKEGEFKICNSSLFACLYTFFLSIMAILK